MVKVPSAIRRLDTYPHKLSGGLRQWAMIAQALSCNPTLLLADEPTMALDVTVQILLLLRSHQREPGMAIIFVTHDIGVACEVADRVAVNQAGGFVETGSVADVIARPAHPYTTGSDRCRNWEVCAMPSSVAPAWDRHCQELGPSIASCIREKCDVTDSIQACSRPG